MAQTGNIGEPVFAPAAIVELEIWTRYSEQASVMRRAYRVDTPVGAGLTFGQILTHFAALVSAPLKPCMHQSASYRGLGIRGVKAQPLGLAAPAYDNLNVGAGTSGVTPLPSQTSGLISLRSNRAGRHGRGRVYVPWPSTTDLGVVELPTAAYVANLQAFGNFLATPQVIVAGANGLTLTPVLYDRVANSAQTITGAQASTRWGTQRRRGDFGPTNSSPV